MEINNVKIDKDGVEVRPTLEMPSTGDQTKQKLIDEGVKKKRRRGKSKRKISKPFVKVPWQNRRRNEKSKRNNRFRKLVLTKTHAPYNNNQFLMEIHKPEPENNFQILQTPARTRDSSFSVDSEDNYFYSLPDDEEDFLTKEFSSVYEDAQTERLSTMSKNELVQEYLLLEAKYENLVKRAERYKQKVDEDKDMTGIDKESMSTGRDTTGTSIELSVSEETTLQEVVQRVKEQEEQIRDLKLANEKLRLENEHLRQHSSQSSSEDSESDSCSTSVNGSSSSSSRSVTPLALPTNEMIDNTTIQENGVNGAEGASVPEYPLVNGFHNESDTQTSELD